MKIDKSKWIWCSEKSERGSFASFLFTRRIENLPTHAPMHVGITPELSLTDTDISPLRSIKCSFIDHSGSRIMVERSADATEQ